MRANISNNYIDDPDLPAGKTIVDIENENGNDNQNENNLGKPITDNNEISNSIPIEVNEILANK